MVEAILLYHVGAAFIFFVTLFMLVYKEGGKVTAFETFLLAMVSLMWPVAIVYCALCMQED